jgi:tRNA nucleotidyltransferase (CCA-adding enzyme)
LNYISWERKKEELEKMILLPSPGIAILQLMDLKLLEYIIPELAELKNLQQNKYHHLDALNHSLQVLNLTQPNHLHRFAALLHDIGKKRCAFIDENQKAHFHSHETVSADIAKTILQRLTCSTHFCEDVSFIIKNHMRFKKAGAKAEQITDKALRRIIMQAGNRWEALLDVIHTDNLAHAEAYSMPEQIPMLKKRVESLQFTKEKQNLPINGNDIKTRFSLKEGIMVGEMLKKAEEFWLESPDVSKEELLQKLEKQN